MAICIRGAVTAQNTREDILLNTGKMLQEMIARNNVQIEDIISVTFTATRDLDAAYPAVAARALGLTEAALMCMQEMYVEGSLMKCIRAGMVVENGRTQKEAVHVYMGGAQVLRPDLLNREDK